MLFGIFKIKHECSHSRVPADIEEAYCPDCGALIQNKWYIVRCSCCNIKRSAHTHYDDIIPDNKFCNNCGGREFYIQELEKLNFIDIHYAVFKKIVVNQQKTAFNQIWTENENPMEPDLISAVKSIPAEIMRPKLC